MLFSKLNQKEGSNTISETKCFWSYMNTIQKVFLQRIFALKSDSRIFSVRLKS